MSFIYGAAAAVALYLLSIFGPRTVRWFNKLDEDERYYLGIMINVIGGICVIIGTPILFGYLIYRNIMYGDHLPGC